MAMIGEVTAARKLSRKRLRQVVLSIPRYALEMVRLRNPTAAYQWFYFKIPYAFPLQAFPSRVSLEPTNECNLACRQCPRPLSVKQRGVGFMEPALFSKITGEVAQHNGCILKIVGLGEPALHPQLGDLLAQVASRRIPCILYTNGELFKRFSTKEICTWNLALLVVSVDGLDATSFARIRVGGNYDELKQRLAEFRRARAELGFSSPEIEIRHVIFPNENAADLLSFRHEWLKISDGVKFNYLYYPLPPGAEVRETRCRDIRREIYIYWNGKVPLCGYQYLSGANENLGDIQKMTIAELWNHPRLAQVRKYHRRRSLDQVPFCKTCTFK